MNKRIKELAKQAWRATFDEVAHLNRIHNRSYSQDEITDIFEIKFAELIVRKCMDICEKQRMKIINNPDDPSWTEHLAECKGKMEVRLIYGVE